MYGGIGDDFCELRCTVMRLLSSSPSRGRPRSRSLPVVCLVLILIASALPAGAQSDAPLWKVAWITDTQTPDCEWIQAMTTRLQAEQPQIVLHTGDTRFEWANRCAWLAVQSMFLATNPPREFHLAPGNHDIDNRVLKRHLREAAVEGRYRLDTGRLEEGKGYYHNRVTEYASGALWPVWNPEILAHPEWRTDANERPPDGVPSRPYRYVFKRGGIRFIIADCYVTEEQTAWVRELLVQPDDSAMTILVQHKHEVDALARYFDGLEGRHNVRLVLSGDHHNYGFVERDGVTYITGAGLAQGRHGVCDGMIFRVFADRIELDRYVLQPGPVPHPIHGPETIWRAEGSFSAYEPPSLPAAVSVPGAAEPDFAAVGDTRTLGPNLLYNGGFDNGVWYERYRGWSPAGWYQWFTRGDDAPEHAVGNSLPHSGAEYVRIHMWAHGWRGGILQTVRDLEPCRYYELSGYGYYQPAGSPNPRTRIGIDPTGAMAAQYHVDVTAHPAPPYDEGIGDDPKTPEVDGPDFAEATVWSPFHDNYTWQKYTVAAEARSATINVILYSDSEQRPADRPIYEMNWDSFALVEIPWPARRLVDTGADLHTERVERPVARVHADLDGAEFTWFTPMPAGASQVLYRFLDSEAVTHFEEPATLREDEFPLESPVVYERRARHHHVSIEAMDIPDDAVELHAVVVSRALVEGECRTYASDRIRVRFR